MTEYLYRKKSILLTGDFNAKCRTLNDLNDIQTSDANDFNIISDLEDPDCTDTLFHDSNLRYVRSSSDRNPCNGNGYKLIDFCNRIYPDIS